MPRNTCIIKKYRIFDTRATSPGNPRAKKHISEKFNKITVFGIYGPTSFKLFHKNNGESGPFFVVPKNSKGVLNMEMNEKALQKKREYARQYRERNRDKINAQNREWRALHPDRVKEYNRRYWEKQAAAEEAGL